MSESTVVKAAIAPPLIRLREVSKAFKLPDGGRFDAVKQVSLEVKAGDVYGLIGKSGAGKSTLLRLINLLERPDAGEVLVNGQNLLGLNKRALREARQSIGMIFQQFNLLQNATVFDNVAFPLRIHGKHSRAEIAARVRECLEIVGLTDKIDAYPAQLSGGQKQRVAIARALAPRPAVLLCDEPTSALDPELVGEVLRVMRGLATEGRTMLVVTHEMEFAREVASQAVFLHQGLIEEQGLPREVLTRPQSERLRQFLSGGLK